MKVVASLLGVGLTGASYVSVTRGGAKQFDKTVTAAFTAHPSNFDRLIAIASDFGSSYAVCGAAGFLFTTGRKTLARDVLVSGLAAWSLAQSVKPLVKRTRPYTDSTAERLVAVPHGSSWPSGHTAVATAIAATIMPRTGIISNVLCGAYALGVGVSRIRVGVHYASDIIAGAGVGLIAAGLSRGVTTRR
ncbi:MAG: phosphatase PAP2 family protein [Nitriliruptoraceae bacterium]